MSDGCFNIQTNNGDGSCFVVNVLRGEGCFTIRTTKGDTDDGDVLVPPFIGGPEIPIEPPIPGGEEFPIENDPYSQYWIAGIVFVYGINPRILEIGEKFSYDSGGSFISRKRYLRERLCNFVEGAIVGVNGYAVEVFPIALQSVSGDYAFPFLDYEWAEDFYYGDQRYFVISMLDFSISEHSKPRGIRYSQNTYDGIYTDGVQWGDYSSMTGTDLKIPAGAGVEYDIDANTIYYGDMISKLYTPLDPSCVWDMDESPEEYPESCITGNPGDTDMIANPLSYSYAKGRKINVNGVDGSVGFVAIHRGDNGYSIVKGVYGDIIITDQGILKNAVKRDVIYQGKFYEQCWITEDENDDIFIVKSIMRAYPLDNWWQTSYWHETRVSSNFVVGSWVEDDYVVNLDSGEWGELPSHIYNLYNSQIVYPDDRHNYKSLNVYPANDFCVEG